MNFEEAADFKSPRKRSRDQFDYDDEMTNDNIFVHGPNK
jgi:hypothetical protein